VLILYGRYFECKKVPIVCNKLESTGYSRKSDLGFFVITERKHLCYQEDQLLHRFEGQLAIEKLAVLRACDMKVRHKRLWHLDR